MINSKMIWIPGSFKLAEPGAKMDSSLTQILKLSLLVVQSLLTENMQLYYFQIGLHVESNLLKRRRTVN